MGTVVVIEPKHIVRHSMKNSLIENGYNAYDFDSLQMLSTQFDILEETNLILLSNYIDTEQSIQLLKDLHKQRNVPVVLITEGITESQFQEALNVGVIDFILRPFDQEDVVDRVKKILPVSSITIQVDDLLSNEVARAERGGYPVSMMLLEIRDDMSYNEKMQMMKRLKKECRRLFRKVDMIYEYGNRLMFIFPITPKIGSLVVAEKLLHHIEQHESVNHIRLGMTTYPDECQNHQELLDFTFRRLKQSDKNPEAILHTVQKALEIQENKVQPSEE
ncbi:response regulator [Texcoconibacillus texcoconensis]|uniref:Response regulator RpfG family c-di-GMP phosphodiesterase n=1 Tax=Texcoconibacillus texcoconensis TaxID=1095777 RepID=A0A840QM98_9BACI|nr:response regulator [Texcoconibacillus texcoconensis]MBB5172505.1 response regulator RpfG family c-di-GMP phosphodiesterase [Texcoconibacillus texcoconensis]